MSYINAMGPPQLIRREGMLATTYRLRRIIWANGRVVAKEFLDFETGEWVEVPEATEIPAQCVLPESKLYLLRGVD